MKWTEEEKQYLRDNFLTMTVKQMAEKLGRKEKTTATACRALGLKKTFRNYSTKHSADKTHTLYQKWLRLKKYKKDKMCKEWYDSYDKFYNWAISQTDNFDLYIDLIDKNGLYEYTNCVFVERTSAHKEHDSQTSINLKKYWENVTQEELEEKELKRKATCIEKYGCESHTQNQEIKEKIKKTNLEKYGFEYASQAPEIIERTRISNIEKYGVDWPTKLEQTKQKALATIEEKYDGKTGFANKDIVEKFNKTMIEKYGDINYANSEECRNKVKETCLKKYGFESPLNSPEIQKKCRETLFKNTGSLYPKRNLKEQNTIKTFLAQFNVDVNADIEVLDGKELDFLSKEHNIAIEYVGIFWHSEKFGRKKKYHWSKYNKCKQKGIRLLTIFSNEWINRRKQCEGFLRAVFGKCSNKVFARKCTVVEIDKNVGQNFLNEYHIQGQKRKGLVYFGLFSGNELIGVLSLNRHHRNNTKTDIVLDRMVFKNDYCVIGGASKMLKSAKEWAKKNNYLRIISWSDNRWSAGNVYEKMGFTKEKDLDPDYNFVSDNKKYTLFKKQSMKDEVYDKTLFKSREEYLKSLGYYKIWDCGKIRWTIYL